MRAFIAIDLPPEIKDYLGRIEERLKASGADVKWVSPANIHLTLKFLGEIDEQKKAALIGIIEDIAKDKTAFSLRLSSAGAFPDIKYPRVIWIGIDEGNAEVLKIAEELEEKIEKIGIPKETREFSSHITIGRVKSGLNRLKLAEGIAGIDQELGGKHLELPVGKITLFKSTLSSKGPAYEPLHETSLRAI
jgi:RNA 2',3'-cyclic 3'-phosphodiesterase